MNKAQVTIRAGDNWLPEAEVQAVTEVRVQQRLSMPTLCELYLRYPPGPLEVANRLTPGTRLRIDVTDQRDPLFEGDVTAVEYVYGAENEQEIYVRGYDPLHRLRKQQHVCVYEEETTVTKLARTLIKRADITGVEGPESEPFEWDRLFQHQQSDLDLLIEVAARAGLYLTMRRNILHLITLAGKGTVQTLTLGKNLQEARLEINTDSTCDTVVATGWNAARIESHQGQAKVGRSGRNVRATVSAGQVGGSGRRDLVNEGTPDQATATALAQAELDQRTATEVTLWGKATGNLALQPGIPVEVLGVADLVAGRYILTEVTHTIETETGLLLTEISTMPPSIQPRPRSDVTTYGIVTDVNDPHGFGRIRARLPTYNNVETDWMAVLGPGAGKNKGFIALPDKGDTVLIILTRENPGHGIVLGGLYGAHNSPDSGISLGSVKRYTWITPGGQKIQLNDRGNMIRIENNAGSYIELDGGKIIIAGSAIDFKQG